MRLLEHDNELLGLQMTPITPYHSDYISSSSNSDGDNDDLNISKYYEEYEDEEEEHEDPDAVKAEAANIHNMLLREQRLAKIDNEAYVFTDDVSGWVKVKSILGMKTISNIGGLYAPVNFDKAVAPIVDYITHSTRIPRVIMGNTITQGSVRYAYRVTSSHIELLPATPLNACTITRGCKSKLTFCSLPTMKHKPIRKLPLRMPMNPTVHGHAVKWIHNSFGESWITIMWLAGDILYDIRNKRSWILYGNSRTGKSKTMSIVKAATTQHAVSISAQYLVEKINAPRSYANTLPVSVLTKVMCTRLALGPDLDITAGVDQFNIQTFKLLTGGDESEYGVVDTTFVAYANRLPTYDSMSTYTAPDRTRRIIVVPSVNRLMVESQDKLPTDDDSMMSLLAVAIYVRYMYSSKPPLTTECLLYTLFMGNYDKIFNVIRYDYDEPCFMTCYMATLILCHYMRIKKEVMQQCLSTVGWNCIRCVAGIYAINNIRVIEGADITPLPTLDELKEMKKNEKKLQTAKNRKEGLKRYMDRQNKDAEEFFKR